MASNVSIKGLASVIENTSRLLHASGHAEGLYPAQWVALRYFAEAPSAQRTASALARYQDMALTPVARSVATLVDKGLLERLPNPKDSRADLLQLTDAGNAMLTVDPQQNLERALSELTAEEVEDYAQVATKLLMRLLELRQEKSGR